MVERYGKWGVVQEPCVGFRTGNDQFKTKFGWLQRLEIDVKAYEQIGDALFDPGSKPHREMRQRVFQTHVMARIVNAKSADGPMPGALKATHYLFGPYRNVQGYWTRALPLLLAPKWLVRRARAAYKRFNTASGAARARALRSE